MMMPPTRDQRDFIERHRLVIVGVGRAKGGPHMSPVYYVMDGDDFLISTTKTRYKTKAIENSPEVSLCIVDEGQPHPYLLIYGTGRIEEEAAVDVMMKVAGVISGTPLPEAARPAIEKRAEDEGRVVLRVTPRRYTSTMPLAMQQKS
jgi:PPOX class probable F420-dependent enzyme